MSFLPGKNMCFLIERLLSFYSLKTHAPLKTYLSTIPWTEIPKYIMFNDVISKNNSKCDQCRRWLALLQTGPTVGGLSVGYQQFIHAWRQGETLGRFWLGPASPPTWREDITNATDWRHVGVDTEPNLNLTNELWSTWIWRHSSHH